MGDTGNDFQRLLVAPASERLFNLHPGERVLEIACGNGVFARRLAELGAQVLATDFSTSLLELARARTCQHAEALAHAHTMQAQGALITERNAVYVVAKKTSKMLCLDPEIERRKTRWV